MWTPGTDALAGDRHNDPVTAPEQVRPPVYACAAGTVLHAHAADTLEPGVLLFTFLPPGVAEGLRIAEPRVDVHADGPQAPTLTVRALVGDTALSWQLPLAPFVAALPGQSGDEGRMVLLAVMDAEPPAGFWAEPVDCEHLAAELQLPVAELAEALRGRLTPWLDEDLRLLLDDDAYHRAAERSPAQTLADAVLATYRGELEAERALTRLLRALSLAPAEHSAELSSRLCTALIAAFEDAEPPVLAQIAQQSGPFESEVLRLITELPPLLATTPEPEQVSATLTLLMVGGDVDETVRGVLSLISRLVRATQDEELNDEALLQRLLMVDDHGLVRLARLWVTLAAGAEEGPTKDAATLLELSARLAAEGRLGRRWLRTTAQQLVSLVEEQGNRQDRVTAPLAALRRLLEPADAGLSAEQQPLDDAATVEACLTLARFVRTKARSGPGTWLDGPAFAAVPAVLQAYGEGLAAETAVDLLAELLAEDVDGPDLLDGFVCATAQLLAALDRPVDEALRQSQVAELLDGLTPGPRGARWLLAACLVEAPQHDPTSLDLSAFVPRTEVVDPDRAADKAGVIGMLRAGLQLLDALARVLGAETQASRLDVLTGIFPTALVEHELIRGPHEH